MQPIHSPVLSSHNLKREPSNSLLKKPIYNRLENALEMQYVEQLVEKAKKHLISPEEERELPNSRCFCINAIARWSESLKVELLPKTVSLLPHDQWVH